MNAESRPSSPADELLAGLMAAGIAFLGLLIPVAHFVLGPLGPLVGAWVVSTRTALGWRGRFIVAAVVGAVDTLVVGGALRVAVWLSSDGQEVPEWLAAWLTPARVGLVLLGVAAWATTLALAGTLVGGAMTGKAPPG